MVVVTIDSINLKFEGKKIQIKKCKTTKIITQNFSLQFFQRMCSDSLESLGDITTNPPYVPASEVAEMMGQNLMNHQQQQPSSVSNNNSDMMGLSMGSTIHQHHQQQQQQQQNVNSIVMNIKPDYGLTAL